VQEIFNLPEPVPQVLVETTVDIQIFSAPEIFNIQPLCLASNVTQ
jgi:hypothetical protein